MNCPRCKSESIETIIFKKKDDDNIYKCLICGYVFTFKYVIHVKRKNLDFLLKNKGGNKINGK